jgi:hypothetical protein
MPDDSETIALRATVVAGNGYPDDYQVIWRVLPNAGSITSVHTQPKTIKTHATRPVYQKRASIMNATPP